MDWSIVLDVGVGVGVLLMGVGILVAMLTLAQTLRRVDVTLDEVDRQIAGIGKPIGEALEHVTGIAQTADSSLARLSGVTSALESVATSLSSTANLAKDALAPGIVNMGATLAGISAGLRRLVSGKRPTNEQP